MTSDPIPVPSPWTKRMPRNLKTDIPGTDWRVSPLEAREKGWREIFATPFAEPAPLVVEIGFGRGEFLMDLALENPERAFVGVEYNRRRVLKMARRLARTEIRNVRLVEGMGQEVVRDIPWTSVAEFWVNFPDPWPKKRHHKNRLLQPEMIHALALRLAPSGILHIATDHSDYAEFIQEGLAGESLLENQLAPLPYHREMPGRMATAYEKIWRELGSAPHFWEYARLAREPEGEEVVDRLGEGAWRPSHAEHRRNS